MDVAEFERRVTALQQKLRTRAGARGKSLRTSLRKAGRLLPRPAQQAGRVLTEAERWMHHPKLRARVDAARVDAAFAEIAAQLDQLDPADRRKGMLLGIAGGLVVNLILLLTGLIMILYWRDLI